MAASPPTPPARWEPIAALYEDEPQAQTIARWRAEHPGEQEPANFIILLPVAPSADPGSRAP